MRIRRSRSTAWGQTTVEIALVFGLFLLALFAIIDASIWGLDSMAATTAAESAARIAVAADTVGTSSQPAFDAADRAARGRLRSAMFGTRLAPARRGPCRSSAEVAADPSYGGPTIEICVHDLGNGFVQVRISGVAAALTPPGLGGKGGLPIDVIAQPHQLVFAR